MRTFDIVFWIIVGILTTILALSILEQYIMEKDILEQKEGIVIDIDFGESKNNVTFNDGTKFIVDKVSITQIPSYVECKRTETKIFGLNWDKCEEK